MKKSMELEGLAISPGLAAGRAYIYRDILQREHEFYLVPQGRIPDELDRVHSAVDEVRAELSETAAQVERVVNNGASMIFLAQRDMLDDPSLMRDLEELLRVEQINAEHVVSRVFQRWERKFLKLKDPMFQQRAEDVADIGRRILRILAGIQAHTLEDMPADSVLFARRLLPSDTVYLSRHSTKAVVVEFGGKVSHTAILTRELGVPAVAQVQGLLDKVRVGDSVLVDGDAGQVVLRPDEETEERFRRRIDSLRSVSA